MINQITAYQQAGRNSARARKQGDEARARFEADYAARMWNVETPENRTLAQVKYREAYRNFNFKGDYHG